MDLAEQRSSTFGDRLSPTDGGSASHSPPHRPSGDGDDSTRPWHLPELSPQDATNIHQAPDAPATRPAKPAMRRGVSQQAHVPDEEVDGPDETGQRAHRAERAREAFERGKQLEKDQRSPHHSPQRPAGGSPGEHIPLHDWRGSPDEKGGDASSDDGVEEDFPPPKLKRAKTFYEVEARNLVRRHMRRPRERASGDETPVTGNRSGWTTPGWATPTEELEDADDYRPRPPAYRGGILGSLLKLYGSQHDDHNSDSSRSTPRSSPPDSGAPTPASPRGAGRRWSPWRRSGSDDSPSSLAQLIGSSTSLGSPMVSGLGEQVSKRLAEREQERREASGQPGHHGRQTSSSSGAAVAAAWSRVTPRRLRLAHQEQQEIRISKHIAEIMSRQRYLRRLCKALMVYGAPTHRLEEYLRMTARVLEIDAQFLYIPGSMIMSFDDPETHTTEVKLVKVAQGLDLGKLRDTHEIYKDVVHDQIGVDEAMVRLKEVMKRANKHSVWVRIPVYGLAAVCVGPFAFQARFVDLPVAFVLGCILGFLQLVVTPASALYANVFEVTAAVITSFLARAFGSIPYRGGRLFCFSALAQSSIALILPGYIVLCASLELQSRSIVAGSVRMVYAIIYTLFLGFGITIGTALYGIADSNATTATECSDPMPGYWYVAFVPGFTMCLIVVNQAKWKQAPVMIVIALVGYLVNMFSAKRFTGNAQVSNTLGALVIGVLANMYSRIGSQVENWTLDRWEDDLRPHWQRLRSRVFGASPRARTPRAVESGVASASASASGLDGGRKRRVGYSLAAAAMLPGIFVQVPSGLAATGSLVSGVASARQITGQATNGSTTVDGSTLSSTSGDLNSVAFNVSYSVVQVAIGITVGLFLSALVVYPYGKRRSGLFSF